MKAFVIVLLESEISVNLSKRAKESAKQFGIDLTEWSAVNGFSCADKFKSYSIKSLLTESMNRPGLQGCFLSHYELWQKCVELNEPILILEHDAVIIRELPTDIDSHYIDVLNLDPHRIHTDNTYFKLLESEKNTAIDYFYAPPRKTSLAGEYVIGAHGYCIKPCGAKKLIKFSQTVGALPTDKHIGRNVVDLKSTTVTVVGLNEFYLENNMKKFSSTKNLQGFVS
jgi:glycosyl transferase family 25